MTATAFEYRDVSLLELLDRALDKGVVLWGDVTLSVADVDLIYLGLKVLLTSVETAKRLRQSPGALDLPAEAGIHSRHS